MPAPVPVVAVGEDWSLPDGADTADGAGFYGHRSDPERHIQLRTVDLSWRQLNPAEGVYLSDQVDRIRPGLSGEVELVSLDAQLGEPGPFWMRIFNSSVEWAPAWVADDCAVELARHHSGALHLPIWDDCVWGHLLEMYRATLVQTGLLADPRLRFVYVPGAFRWAEFDFGAMRGAADAGQLEEAAYVDWFRRMVADLVALAGEHRGKLVFTGEDFPYDVPPAWDAETIGLLPSEAVAAGIGIRNGIPENHNSHLNHAPAYGSRITQEGYVETDEDWPALGDGRVLGMESECFGSCGLPAGDGHDLKLANLKALQLRASWMYVTPVGSRLDDFPAHWDWVRRSLGHTPETATDAWSAPRETTDRFWRGQAVHDWPTRPWVRNTERWVRQRDVEPDGVTRRGPLREGDLFNDDHPSYEGRRTDVAQAHPAMYFEVEDRFAGDGPLQVKVTYVDRGARWRLEYGTLACGTRSQSIEGVGDDALRTATFELPDAHLANQLRGSDLRLVAEGETDLEVRFLRVVKRP